MGAYIIRRVLYAIPILICVNIITFLLFFYVNTPDDVAHTVLGQKRALPSNVYTWKREHNYHLPMMVNGEDSILYVTKNNAVSEDIQKALEDYTVQICSLDATAVAKGILELIAEQDPALAKDKKKLPGPIDGFKRIIDKQKEEMDGDEVILVDCQELTPQEAMIISGLLEKGVPFIVISRDEKPLPKPLDVSVIVNHVIDDKSPDKSLKELSEYIEAQQVRGLGVFTQTIFFKKSVRLFWFNFGKSDRENIDISYQVLARMGPSMMITIPAFVLSIFVNIFIAMIVAYTRGTYIDRMMAIVCIIIMSILSLFYYFGAQFIFGTWLKIFPVSGFLPGFSALRFVLLPVIVSVIIGIGGGVRFYRTIFLEEVNRDYVRTARSKGMSEMVVLFKHVLKNAMIPILTNVVLVLPMLFMGSLILESFFGIPGLGGFTLEGIQAQDFRIVGAMVYLGSFLYIIGLIMTDISYTLVDPRVKIE